MKQHLLTKYAILAVISLSGAAFAASGAAAIVAKAAGKSYSEPTRRNFLKSCSESVETPICECVLKKLEVNYSEDQFKHLEATLSVGVEDKDYVNFIVDATTTCGMSYDAGAANSATQPAAANAQPAPAADPQMTEMEIMILKAIVDNKEFKNGFVAQCANEADDLLGPKQAKKSCDCAYSRIMKDDKVMMTLLASADLGSSSINFEKWGYDIIAPCLPDKFTAEMEKALTDECKKQASDSPKACKCVVKEIKKRYTVKSLLKAAFENQKKLELEMMGVAAQCMAK